MNALNLSQIKSYDFDLCIIKKIDDFWVLHFGYQTSIIDDFYFLVTQKNNIRKFKTLDSAYSVCSSLLSDSSIVYIDIKND